jgi:nucleotide-binding universal stress UspA family protein
MGARRERAEKETAMNGRRLPVVAGVSRARSSINEPMLAWAADEAAWRDAPLLLLHAQEWPRPARASGETEESVWSTHLRAGGEHRLREAQDSVLARRPDLDVRTELASGRATAVLREAADSACLLVLGVRRYSALEDPFAGGGRAEALAGHLPCPLLVVPEREPAMSPDARVMVGVDGSAASAGAVAAAFEEAASTGADLVAVQVRRRRDVGLPQFPEDSELVLSEQLAGYQEKYPDVVVHEEILTGKPGAVLARAARSARCLVVGTRGRHGFRHMTLGSTSRALLHTADCPLLLTPAPAEG